MLATISLSLGPRPIPDVEGARAAWGMAFTDSLIDHADVHVTLVDLRAAGGHWQDAFPFVQLHQASLFYGIASTLLGSGAVQAQRAGGRVWGIGPSIGDSRAYYDQILYRGLLARGRVTFLAGGEYRSLGSFHLVTSGVSGVP